LAFPVGTAVLISTGHFVVDRQLWVAHGLGKIPEPEIGAYWGFRTMPISVPGHADHPFRDDGDHDSGMMPITRSGMIPIS